MSNQILETETELQHTLNRFIENQEMTVLASVHTNNTEFILSVRIDDIN